MTDPTEAQLIARYRARLLDEEVALATASAETREARRPVELDQQSIGRLSRQDALQQQAMATAQQMRRANRGRAIAAALLRMDEGEFGYCAQCGEFIGFGRLDLDPCLATCRDCAC
ncbi:MAG: TraR/DksA family transcriptional regulator [Pseudomonadota bacterium]